MMEKEQLEQIASLLGDPSRMKMLWTLLDGRAYTSTELAIAADISRQSTSMHLGKLVAAGLLKENRQGRHKYYSFARPEIAYAVEGMSALVPVPKATIVVKQEPVKYCRSCYDHMAGLAGVRLLERLTALHYLVLENDEISITTAGHSFFHQLGIDTKSISTGKRPAIRACLDWSERRFHLAGALGSALLKKMIAEDWVRRIPGSRALVITANGQASFFKNFGMEI